MKLPRYSLAFLLLLVAIVAGFFAGHHRGYELGFQHWQKLPVKTVTYSVTDLIERESSADGQMKDSEILVEEFAELVRNQVMPEFWDVDPNTTLSPFSANKSLIVSGNDMMHSSVREFLAEFREESEWRIATAGNQSERIR
jgi:hypothetical protein